MPEKESQQVVPPTRSAVMRVLREMKREDVKEETGIVPEDRVLVELSDMPGWGLLKKYIEKRIGALEGLVGLDTVGKGLEEIGLRFLVAQLATSELQRVIDRVEGTRRAVEEIRKEAKKKKK